MPADCTYSVHHMLEQEDNQIHTNSAHLLLDLTSNTRQCHSGRCPSTHSVDVQVWVLFATQIGLWSGCDLLSIVQYAAANLRGASGDSGPFLTAAINCPMMQGCQQPQNRKLTDVVKAQQSCSSMRSYISITLSQLALRISSQLTHMAGRRYNA